jgi:hypothetical protein
MKIEGKRMCGGCIDVIVIARVCVRVCFRVGACECVRPNTRASRIRQHVSQPHSVVMSRAVTEKR